ncbi:MAG: DNA glycosylase [bacterium]
MIAEFMLHRTKADQVVPVYKAFLVTYPSIFKLAEANYDEVSRFTKHLGLHWRSKHMLDAAKYIVDGLNGTFPQSRSGLKKIPGVGDYISGAILTICFNEPVYVVDSNIARFINRFFGLKLSGELRRKKKVIEIARDLFDIEHPGEFLFAIIDFTSLICTPKNSKCSNCILLNLCRFDDKCNIR